MIIKHGKDSRLTSKRKKKQWKLVIQYKENDAHEKNFS